MINNIRVFCFDILKCSKTRLTKKVTISAMTMVSIKVNVSPVNLLTKK